MTSYSVACNETGEHAVFYSVGPAKKWMKERIKQGYTVYGDKTRIYANGDWVPCGPIELKGSNKVFIANSGMKQPNY